MRPFLRMVGEEIPLASAPLGLPRTSTVGLTRRPATPRLFLFNVSDNILEEHELMYINLGISIFRTFG